MDARLEERLISELRDGDRLGLIGVGERGRDVQTWAETHGIATVLCDPPRSVDDSDELGGTFFQLWGNGMGGCDLTNKGMETFLPLNYVAKQCRVMVVQVPLTCEGPWATAGMLNRAFLSDCRSDAVILCASDAEVISPEVVGDPRLVVL